MEFSRAICDRANDIISPDEGEALTRFCGECLVLEYPDQASISALQYLSSFEFQTGTIADFRETPEGQRQSIGMDKTLSNILEWKAKAEEHLQALGITNDVTAAQWMDELQPRLQQWRKEMQGLDTEVAAKVAALAEAFVRELANPHGPCGLS